MLELVELTFGGDGGAWPDQRIERGIAEVNVARHYVDIKRSKADTGLLNVETSANRPNTILPIAQTLAVQIKIKLWREERACRTAACFERPCHFSADDVAQAAEVRRIKIEVQIHRVIEDVNIPVCRRLDRAQFSRKSR